VVKTPRSFLKVRPRESLPILVAISPNAGHFDSARMRQITINLEKMTAILGYWFQLAEKRLTF
tara:strand:- start:231 stop:419 length:189 start_codon:yes stop_codon:yes gene_type:complete